MRLLIGREKTQNETIHRTHPRAQQKDRPNTCASGSSQESWSTNKPVFLPKILATLCGRRGKRQDVGVIALDSRKDRQYGTSALKSQKAQSEVLGGPTYFITFISCPLSLPTCPHFCPHNPQATAPTQDALLHLPQVLCTCACTRGAAKLLDTAVQAGHHTGCCFHTADITGVYQQSLAGGRKMHLFSFNHLYIGAIWASRALLFALPRI